MLIICEKRNVALSFVEALGSFKYNSGYYYNDSISITFCYGHLYRLLKPHEYKTPQELPIIPSPFEYTQKEIINEKTGRNIIADQIHVINKLLESHINKNDKIIIATDADREGELIAREILKMAKPQIKSLVNFYRFWVSEALTKDVIIKGLKEVKPLRDYFNLAAKGYARQHADWLVGMNLSIYLSKDNSEQFTVGRVQTALLAAIAQRNMDITNFTPKDYFECLVNLKDLHGNNLNALLINPKDKSTAFSAIDESLNKALEFLNKSPALDIKSNFVTKNELPKKLLSLTDLSSLASKYFDYSASLTLDIAEKLYLEYKCLSYPRTPSNVLGDDNVELCKSVFDKIKSYSEASLFCNTQLIDIRNKRVFDSSKLDSHHALIPLALLPENATQQEKNIYDLVYFNFIQNFMSNFTYEEKQLLISTGSYLLKASSKRVLDEGWKKTEKFCYWKNKEKSNSSEFSPFDEKASKIESAQILKKQTKPLQNFTESSLLDFMKNPKSEDKEKLVGLGTEATRGSIIEKLFKLNYIEKKGKSIYATDKGFYLLNQLVNDKHLSKIANISQTTEWESQLEEDPKKFSESIKNYIINSIDKNKKFIPYTGNKIIECPVCNNIIIRTPTVYKCMNKECKIIIPVKFFGSTISITDVKNLFIKKQTSQKKFTSRKGKTFPAILKADLIDGSVKLSFEFINEKNKHKDQKNPV